jgi:hypothetical protein
MGYSTNFGVVLGVIGMLCLFSLLYRENRVYRAVEHIFVGLAGGYMIKAVWSDILFPNWYKPMVNDGQWPLMLLLPLGLLYYTMYSPRYSWMSKITLGIVLGLVSGQIFQRMASEYIPQIQKSFKPLVVHAGDKSIPAHGTAFGTSLNNLLFVLILLTVMSYFFFSFEQKNKILAGSARTGRLAMMFAFGAIFGSTVMARMALLIDRVWFILHNNAWQIR